MSTSRRKRLAIVVPTHWSDRMGGAQLQMKMLIGLLTEQGGYEVDYVCRRAGQEQPDDHTIVSVASRFLPRRLAFVEEAVRLLMYLMKNRPDAVIQSVACGFTGVVGLWGFFVRSCNTVWRVSSDRYLDRHMLRGLGMFSNWVIYLGIKSYRNIIVQTRFQQSRLEALYGLDGRCTMIRNSYLSDAKDAGSAMAQNAWMAPDKTRIVWIGNIKPIKQVDVFLSLARAFQSDPARVFVIAGRMPDDEVQKQALLDELDAHDNMHYAGVLPIEDVDALLAQSRLLVNTSWFEGFSNTYIQAWRVGVKVLSLNANPDELLARPELGFCAEGDENKLLEYVGGLDPEAHREDSATRDYYESHHGITNLGRYIAVIEQQEVG